MRFIYKLYISIKLSFLIFLVGRENILEQIESNVVSLYMRTVDFHALKGSKQETIDSFILAFAYLTTRDLSWFFPQMRNEIIKKVFKKCSRKTKWEVSLIKE